MSSGLKGYKPDTARWPVLRHGLIFFKGGSAVCFVLNRSRGGAGLVLQSDVHLPVVFDLEIDGENIRYRCVAVWRDQCHIGVSFDLDRLTQVASSDEAVEQEAVFEPASMAAEQGLASLVSALRAVMTQDDAAALGTSENPAIPGRTKVGRG